MIPVSAKARPNVNRPTFVNSPANRPRLFAPIGRVMSAPVTGTRTGVLVPVTTGGGRVTILVTVGMKPEAGVNVVVGACVSVAVDVEIKPLDGVRVVVGVAVAVSVTTF